MSRPRKLRYINFTPGVTYFKPQGVPLRLLEEVELSADELESIRLKNYKNLSQIDCAKKMKISQSTFQRILTSANKKISQALIEGKAIKIISTNIKTLHRRYCWPRKGLGLRRY